FFFQAEDGIRDRNVTGVQTCALPILAAVSRIANPVTLARRVMEASRHILLVGEGALAFARAQGLPECDPEALVTERQRVRHRERSEERRVGKEWRAGGEERQ